MFGNSNTEKLADIEKKIQLKNSELDKKNSEYFALVDFVEKKKVELKNKSDEIDLSIIEQDNRLKEKQKELDDINELLSKIKKEIEILQQASIDIQKANYNDEKLYSEEVNNRSENISKLKEEQYKLEVILSNLQIQYNQKKDIYTEEYEKNNKELNELNNKIFITKQLIDSLNGDISTLQNEKTQSHNELLSLHGQVSAKKIELSNINSDIEKNKEDYLLWLKHQEEGLKEQVDDLLEEKRLFEEHRKSELDIIQQEKNILIEDNKTMDIRAIALAEMSSKLEEQKQNNEDDYIQRENEIKKGEIFIEQQKKLLSDKESSLEAEKNQLLLERIEFNKMKSKFTLQQAQLGTKQNQ